MSPAASRAVRSDPLLNAASTTSVLNDSAAMRRLRIRNLCGIAVTPGITSLMIAPFSQISSKSRALPAGYCTSMPEAITAIVRPSATSAPRWAAVSIPYAPPLMMSHSRSTKPAAKSPAKRTPYGVGFLVPTMAREGLFRIEMSPFTIRPSGGIAN